MDHHQRSEIEHAIHQLSPGERESLASARDLAKSIAKGKHLNDWLSLGESQKIGSRLAMRLAQTNQRAGALYTKYLHQLLQYDGIDTDDKKIMSSLTAVSWLVDDEHPKRLATLHEGRAGMSQGELSRMNSPITARTFVQKILKPRAPAPAKQQDEPNENIEGTLADRFNSDSDMDIAATMIKVDALKAMRVALTILASLDVKVG
jgi:hypothetical protein